MKKILCLVPILTLLLSNCFNPLDSNSEQEATLSITLPSWGSGNGKAAWDTGILTYEVTGDGPSGKSFSKSAPAGDTVTVRIVPGSWQIEVKARGTSTPTGEYEIDSGIQNISVKAGVTNKPTITMRFRRIELIYDYLNYVGGTKTAPASLHLAIELSDSNWNDLLAAINTASQYVALDLSACTAAASTSAYGLKNGSPYVIFDPNSSDSTGKDMIVSLVLPEATQEILGGIGGNSTFMSFDSLTEITIGGNITTIGEFAFDSSNLERVTIGDSVTEIKDGAFQYCDQLTSVTIGNGVTAIGNYAFESCTSLSSVSLGNSITTIGHYAFWHNDILTSIIIPNSVISIDDRAFEYCDLTELTIGNSVQSIGQYAFSDNLRLEDVIIPDSVITIDNFAFFDCSLKTLEIGNLVETIGNTAFSDNELTGEIIIPDSVNTIGDSAFFGNKITKVTIPDNINIGQTAFMGNNDLTTVIFGGDNVAFYNSTFESGLDVEFFRSGGGAGTYELDGFNTWVKQ